MINFRKIRSGIHSCLSRIFGREEQPQLINPDQEYFVPPSNGYDNPNPNQPPWVDELDEVSAIRRTFIPNQSDWQLFSIRRFPQNGTMPSGGEQLIFSDDGMQRIETRISTILACNEVASPREIGGICVCKQPIRASRIRPCHICGACLCRQCGRLQPVPPGILNIPVSALILCPVHLKEFRDQWPHWLAAGPTGEPVFLPQDMSIAILDGLSGDAS